MSSKMNLVRLLNGRQLVRHAAVVRALPRSFSAGQDQRNEQFSEQPRFQNPWPRPQSNASVQGTQQDQTQQQAPAYIQQTSFQQPHSSEQAAPYQATSNPQEESAWQGPPPAPGSNAALAVDPPPRCAWHQDHVNSVRLIGRVGAPPEIRHMAGGKVLASFSLAVAPRFSRAADPPPDWFKVDFWGFEARQIEQHVQKGMQLAVGGHLKRDNWVTASGEERSVIKVVGEYFQVVDPSQGILIGDNSAAAEVPTGLPRTARAQRQPKGRFDPPTRNAEATHQLWLSSPSMSWAKAAEARGIKPSLAIDHLVTVATANAAAGQIADLPRLASELQIGYPQSPWITVGDIKSAVSVAVSEAEQAGEPSSLDRIYLRRIRSALEANAGASTKVLAQEQALGALRTSLTYCQIRLVLGCEAASVDLEAVATQTPLPVNELLAPAGGFGGVAAPEEAPF